jgi:alpha-tubulin suppressor-like RCC1 family protein
MGMDEYFDSGFEDRNTIDQIALGAKHSLFLTNRGRLYVCGYGSQGQLGLGKSFTSNCYEPTLVKSLVGKQIIMIAAGSNHSLALTSRYDVYSCGHNAKGQLGLGESKSCTVWTHISALSHKKVARIYSGGEHSWAVIGNFSV